MPIHKDDKDKCLYLLAALVKSLEDAPVDFQGTASHDTQPEAINILNFYNL